MDGLLLALVVISALLLLLAAVRCFAAAYLSCWASTKKVDLEIGTAKVADVDTKEAAAVAGGGGVRKCGWKEIEALTENFSTPVIGHGGFSTVYLGKPRSGSDSCQLVAVKVHRESERLHVAFKQELEVLLKLRHHSNVVKLVGYCDEPDDDGALVFEYIPNGTLHDKLHGGNGGILTWSERMTIAHDLAKAVAYLHESCDLQIIHSDLKPANILLDSDHRAKLCDFGSARIGFSSTVVRGRHAMVGSPGYSDPHFLRTGMTSKKSDVYSFGVVLLELVTGKEAFCEQKGRMLTNDMSEVLIEAEARAGEMVDGRLGQRFVAEEAVAVAEVVRRCVGDQPSLRPSMADIVGVLDEMVGRSICKCNN